MTKTTDVAEYSPKLGIKQMQRAMMESPELAQVASELFRIALDGDSKDQLGAIKAIMDRTAPIASFAAAAENKGSSERQTVNIVISGIGGEPADATTTTIDIEAPE